MDIESGTRSNSIRYSSKRIAFYGSLNVDHDLLERLKIQRFIRCIGPCQIAGRIYDLGEYPGLRPGSGVVHGRLFECHNAWVLGVLDDFEEYYPMDRSSSLFVRTQVKLIEPQVKAWIYQYNKPTLSAPIIESGSWANYRRGKESHLNR